MREAEQLPLLIIILLLLNLKLQQTILSNPKDASNIHSPHHHYHIGYPHH